MDIKTILYTKFGYDKMRKLFLGFLFLGVVSAAQTGIGTTTPVNKFQVEATTADPATSGASANGNFRLSGTGASHVLDFGLSSSSTYSWLQARSKSAYGTYYNLLLNPNGGNVGIGTTSPLTTLTVGNVGGTVPGEIVLNPTSTQYEGGQITFKKSLLGSTVDWTIDQYGSTSANARFRIFNGTSETNGLAILENGNLGIGTTSPTAKLNIAGGGIRIATGFGNATTRPALNTGSVGSYEIRGVGAGGGGTAQSDGSDDGFLRLSAGGGTNTNTQASIDLSGYSTVADMSSTIAMRTLGTERLRIDPYGKVGLGTSSPTTSLHIENGNTFGTPASTSSPSIYVLNNNNASSTANSTVSVRTAGTGSGKPYYSLDVSGAFGYSMGVNNPTDQMIINTSWDFNTTAANNALTINRSGRSRVVIPEQGGASNSDWPIWGGGLSTYDICAASIIASNYITRSDRRLKNTITSIDNSAVSKYLNLRPVTFYWNQDKPRDPSLQFGLIAQEVEVLFPEMVNTATDEMQTKSVNYQALHALSLKVIQSQQAEIEDLKKKQADMEARLLQLEAKLK
jgi:hypothetical protein